MRHHRQHEKAFTRQREQAAKMTCRAGRSCKMRLPRRHFCERAGEREPHPSHHRSDVSLSKALCADSESRFLAIKKFSCSASSCHIIPRQNPIFARIDAADSETHDCFARELCRVRGEQLVHMRKRMRTTRRRTPPPKAYLKCRVWI